VAGQIIHFEREADGQLRKILLRLADFGDVFIEFVAKFIRQLSKSSCGIGAWSEKPISLNPSASARRHIPPARRARGGRAACACDNRRANASVEC
jgi:hypothetical protein